MTHSAFLPLYGTTQSKPQRTCAFSRIAGTNTWRQALIRNLDPRPGDVIADLDCGTGALAALIKQAQPRATVFALSANPRALGIAEAKAAAADVPLHFVHGSMHDAHRVLPSHGVNKIVVSHALLALPDADRHALFLSAWAALMEAGELHLANHRPYRVLFSTADDDAPIQNWGNAGFSVLRTDQIFYTLNGSVALASARKRALRAA